MKRPVPRGSPGPRVPHVRLSVTAPLRVLLLVLLAAALLLLGSISTGPGEPAEPAPASRVPAGAPLDSAAAELQAGRPWHAARVLRTAPGGATALDPEGKLLLARADAASRSWARVVEGLEGESWLDDVGAGEGWTLLGRGLEGVERWQGAADAYGRYLALAGTGDAEGYGALARRARALGRSASWQESLAALEELHQGHALVADWLALELAGAAAEEGETPQVRALLATVTDTGVRGRGWDLEARALLASGDTAQARSVLSALTASLSDAGRRAEAWLLLGPLLLRAGESGSARDAFRQALASGELGAQGAGLAARELLALGELDGATALQVARALDRVNEDARALEAYDLHRRLSPDLSADARLARARLMANVPARHEEAVEELRALSTSETPEVGAAALDEWALLRGRQRRAQDARTLRERLIERFPRSAQAADVLFLRADAAHDQRDLPQALAGYRRLVELSPSQDRAGLARMRCGQLHLHQGEPARAAEVFESYLAEFPTGRRWEEATYWAAIARAESGDDARARTLMAELRAKEPFGYYAMLASDFLGEPFEVDVPEGEAPGMPAWLPDALETLDLLVAAGLETGASAAVEALKARARPAPAETFRLALELILRGYTLDGINLGLGLREQGQPWTRRLLEVVYPLPNPERVRREAAEHGIDPLLVAGLIRQESAWDEDIVSPAGAVGLMQVMPETGRTVFGALGEGEFRPEMLEVGDLNMHLGTSYLKDGLERYGGDVALALSAYNAGPHRADVWKDFPEAADLLRLTERIPFAETREYVKRVRRNRVLYDALYGEEL